MRWSGGDIVFVLWLAVLPAWLSVLTLLLFVKEPARPSDGTAQPRSFGLGSMRGLGMRYWLVVSVGVLLFLARFSEAFLVLRASASGLPLSYVPLVLVVMNVSYGLSAFPVGKLADRVAPRTLVLAAFAVLVAADLMLAWAVSLPVMFAGVVVWGLHMGLSQGVLAMWVAQVSPPARRATAFGAFHLSTGLASLVGSLCAGALWDRHGPGLTFVVSAAAALLGLALTALLAGSPEPLPEA